MVRKIETKKQILLNGPLAVFDKDGLFYWPGELEECYTLLESIHLYDNIDQLLKCVEFKPEIYDKIKNWSLLDLACSLYSYYIMIISREREKIGDPPVSKTFWSVAGPLILNSKISINFTNFINNLDLPNQSTKNQILDGITYSLLYTLIKSKNLYSKKSFRNLLSFVDLSKNKCEFLIEQVFAQRSTSLLIKELLKLKESYNSPGG